MKEALSVFLALVLCLSLSACGTGSGDTTMLTTTIPSITVPETTIPETTVMTKEELLVDAMAVDADELFKVTFDNLAKAKSQFCNKILLFSGWIMEIKEDHIVLGGAYAQIDVYLPLEEILLLETYQYLTVVGQTSENIEEELYEYFGMVESIYHYQMPVAYFVSDTIELSVIFDSRGLREDGSSHYLKLTWAEDVDAEKYKGHKLVISAKAKAIPTQQIQYYDATVVEVIS